MIRSIPSLEDSNIIEFLKKLLPYDVPGLDKIRLGQDFDGGYIIPKEVIPPCEALLTLGVADDLSFEEDFLQIRKVPIYCVDHSIKRLPPLNKAENKSFFFHERTFCACKTLFDTININTTIWMLYKFWLPHNCKKLWANCKKVIKLLLGKLNKRFLERIVKIKAEVHAKTYRPIPTHCIIRTEKEYTKLLLAGYASGPWGLALKSRLTTLGELLQKHELQNKKIGIKIDIEGSELQVLEDLGDEIFSSLQFLIIEFHWLGNEYVCTKLSPLLDRILDHMTLVHTHENNYSKLLEFDGLTFFSCYECTFINKSFTRGKTCTPAKLAHPLDQDCRPNTPKREANFLDKLAYG